MMNVPYEVIILMKQSLEETISCTQCVTIGNENDIFASVIRQISSDTCENIV